MSTVPAPIDLTRAEWGAVLGRGPNMDLPAEGATFHHSVTIANDDHDLLATADVADDMRELEAVGKARFGRFSYCYAIHPSGVIGEGAGLTIGAHTKGFNSTRIGLVFIGNLSEAPLTPEAEAAAVRLLVWLAAIGALAQGYNVDGHRDHKSTECPGSNVYPELPSIHAQALGQNSEEPDMTPAERAMLEELHSAFIGADKPPTPGAFRRVLQKSEALADAFIAPGTNAPSPGAFRKALAEAAKKAGPTAKKAGGVIKKAAGRR